MAEELAAAQKNGRIAGDLLPHQIQSVQWMIEREKMFGLGGILADDMGLGKTYQIAALIAAHETDVSRSTLIVTVLSTIGQWQAVLQKFVGINAFVVASNSSQPLPSRTAVVLTTYSAFQQIRDPVHLMRRNWHRIVLDEGHVIKDPGSKTHQRIRRLTQDDQFRWIVSGTPVQNHARELQTLLSWVGSDESCMLRRTVEDANLSLPPLVTKVKYIFFRYPDERELYARLCKEDGDHLDSTLRLRQVCVHTELYHDGMDRKLKRKRTACDIACSKICTVDPFYNDYQVDGCDMLALYRIQHEQLAGVTDACEEGSLCESRRAKETRVCDSDECVSSDEEDVRNIGDLLGRRDLITFDEYSEGRSSKMDYLLRKLVRDRARGEKSLVFCKFKKEMDMLCQVLEMDNICYVRYDGEMSRSKRECSVFNFDHEPEVTAMVIQIQAGGVGLNLQSASRVYITAPEWNPVVELQAIGRAHRLHQTRSVKCIRLVMAGTIEEIACMRTEHDKLTVISKCLGGDNSGMVKLGHTSDAFRVAAFARRYDILSQLLKRQTLSDPSQ